MKDGEIERLRDGEMEKTKTQTAEPIHSRSGRGKPLHWDQYIYKKRYFFLVPTVADGSVWRQMGN